MHPIPNEKRRVCAVFLTNNIHLFILEISARSFRNKMAIGRFVAEDTRLHVVRIEVIQNVTPCPWVTLPRIFEGM